MSNKRKIVGLFVHDGPIYKDKNGVYCSTNITEEMLSRYFCVADEIKVLIRTREINETYEDANLQKIDNPKIEIVELGNMVSVKGLLQKSKLAKTIKPVVDKCDLVFLRLPGITCNTVADICKKENKKYLVEVGGCAWDAYWNHGILGKIVAPYTEWSQKKTTKNASFVIYVTSKWLQNRYPCSCEWVEASNVYLPKSDEKILQERIRRIEQYKDCKKMVIGTIANVDVRYKGQEYIIKAIARLNKSGYNFKYELVGGGGSTFLKNLARKYRIEDDVIFKGPMLHNNIMKWLDTVDIYAQPSKQEGLPRSVIEAMSRGVPCIGSTTAGIPELLNTKMIFPNGNVKKIEEILSSLNKKTLVDLAEENYVAAKKFDLSILNKRRDNFYKKYQNEILNKVGQ